MSDNSQPTPSPETPRTPDASVPPRPPMPAQPTISHTQPTLPVPPAAYAPASQQYAPAYTGAPAPAQSPAPTYAYAAPTAPAKAQKVGAGKVVGLLVAAALVGGAAGLGGAAAGASFFTSPTTVAAGEPSSITINNPDSVNATTAVAAKVLPSVVTISATSGSSGGTGSGVILSDDGYIVTNTHVVTLDGATADPTLSVTTSDGKVYAATVVGTDPTYDLAVIKLTDASGLTPVTFGDSSALNVGDQTVAIGAPLGLSNTVTTGIVSALNRSIQIASSAAPDSSSEDSTTPDDGTNPDSGQSPFQFDFGQGEEQQAPASSSISIAVIQTDAAINPGNSGGALVNDKGELIGINVAIAGAGNSGSGQSGNIGVGFSIPSDVAKRVTGEIIKDGSATHGLLGASVGDAGAAEGATIAGALIADVSSGGGAAAAGIQKGDVVTALGGVPITSAVDLTAQVRALAAGTDTQVTFVRDGKTQTVDVTLGELTQ